MEITIKKDVNTKSLVLRHQMLEQAVVLLGERDEALQTEKDLYIMLSMIDWLAEEDILKYCNESEENLIDILEREVEPTFLKLLEQEDYRELYEFLREELDDYCYYQYESNHNIVKMITTIASIFADMTSEDKAKALEKTAEIAKETEIAKEEIKAEKTEKINAKLEALVEQYQKKSVEENKEPKENSAE